MKLADPTPDPAIYEEAGPVGMALQAGELRRGAAAAIRAAERLIAEEASPASVSVCLQLALSNALLSGVLELAMLADGLAQNGDATLNELEAIREAIGRP